ncbi:MAG: YhgE/Pip domain-containing protein [Liquorilactobacillus nagelii]|uniref:YhgE/Pip domain-containing protein n=2 Tax=Liquorilactobacillus nagelii TaxID=82688 RepID=UPI0021C48335|nr:YhgE/Pip domain-containing protein [Liquorilactobacillus nagelii]
MSSLKMVKEEFKHMGEHKLLIATICAIMIIPFLYSVFFLKSVWDPYGNSGFLPVAVVNEDQTVAYNGKKMKVGEDLVKKLKKNDDLDWHFVSAKQAKYGISHKKYYMVVTIPKNFSKNATTVLDKTPKKMQLKYKTNDSLNYIGKVISEEGVKQLNTEVRKSVSTAYAKTMFATIKKVGKGFSTAAKGADKLKTGSNTLTDGINTYTAGVKKVNDGVIELQTGVVPLSSGVLKLTTGATALSSGVQEYTAGVAKVNTGTQKLNSSTGTLATGVGKLASGSTTLVSGLETLSSNSNSLNAANTKINNGLSELSSKTKNMPTQIAELKSGTEQLSSGISTLNSSVDGLLTDDNKTILNNLMNIGNELEQTDTSNLSQLVSSAKSLNDNESLKQLLNNTDSTSLTKLQSQLNDILTILDNISTIKTQLNTLMATILPTINGKTLGVSEAQQELTVISSNPSSFISGLMSGTITISSDSSLGASINAILGEIKNGDISQAKGPTVLAQVIGAQVKVMENQMNDYNSILSLQSKLQNTSLTDSDVSTIKAQIGLVNGVLNNKSDLLVLTKSASKITDAQIEQLNSISGAKTAYAANKDKLTNLLSSWDNLKSQISALNTGAQNINSGVETLNSSTPTLVSGINQLFNGSTQLTSGTEAYTAGVSSATSGASQLSSGLGTLNSNVPTLVSGVSQLASGTQTLSNNSSTLNSGASQLASGLTTLNNKVPTLTSGVNQLASGTSQLAANSDKLSTGSAKLTTGNKALAKALNKGAKQVNAVKTSNKTANMFAAPSNLKHSNYSKVPNYGYALAPYMLSVALFVGSLVFNLVYPIRRMSSDGTGTEWFLSKVSVGFLVATGNALIETIFMMVFGLVPMHLPSMIINALFFSYSAMFLIMFMSMLGNNPGRFLAMILLVIQLGACGGSFPIQITNGMNGFFQAINPFLPMTYSVLGFRQALNSGLGEHQVIVSVGVLSAFIIVCLFLLWLTMTTFVKKGIVTYEENKPDSNYPGN